jgi:hypothetical protein
LRLNRGLYNIRAFNIAGFMISFAVSAIGRINIRMIRGQIKVRMTRTVCVLTFVAFVLILTPVASAQDNFSVREYNVFHDLLHPLEHEALPAKDFQRIRSNAADLVRRGEAIVGVGVPQGTAEKNREGFRKEMKKFKSALTKLRKEAKRGTDAQLEASFSAVHDSFEMLAGMLPRK